MFKYKNITGALLLLTFFCGFTACKKTRIDSPRQRLAKESVLLQEFLDHVNEDKVDNPKELNTRDFLKDKAIRTIDSLDVNKMSGIAIFITNDGKASSPKPVYGQEVGYRYVEYQIARDKSNVPIAGAVSSNYGEVNPKTFVMGQTTARDGIPEGIIGALKNMHLNGRCTVIMPSTLVGGYDNVSRLYELKLTYMSPIDK